MSFSSLDQPPPKQNEFIPVPPGSYNSAAIIMLTDGQRTTGVDPIEAAKLAADRGVKVYTVGVGTVDGETIGFEGWSMRVRLDEETLKAIAQKTAAEYYYAGTAQDLQKVYQNLSSLLTLERKETEVSALFALAGALLASEAAVDVTAHQVRAGETSVPISRTPRRRASSIRSPRVVRQSAAMPSTCARRAASIPSGSSSLSRTSIPTTVTPRARLSW